MRENKMKLKRFINKLAVGINKQLDYLGILLLAAGMLPVREIRSRCIYAELNL